MHSLYPTQLFWVYQSPNGNTNGVVEEVMKEHEGSLSTGIHTREGELCSFEIVMDSRERMELPVLSW